MTRLANTAKSRQTGERHVGALEALNAWILLIMAGDSTRGQNRRRTDPGTGTGSTSRSRTAKSRISGRDGI